MQVETYEVEEVNQEAQALAADAEACELIEQLNLEGQKSLCDNKTLTRLPYRKVTAREMAVFKTLMPEVTEISKYKDGILPIRVLKVVAYAQSLKMFKRIVVWHPTNADEKDPVLVGEKDIENNTWQVENFLLARWGEELLPMEKLTEKAIKKASTVYRAALAKMQQELTGAVNCASTTVEAAMATGKLLTPHIYVE